MAADPALAVALGLALTGEQLSLESPSALPEELAALDYPAQALRELREARQQAREPWPFPVPIDQRRAVGFARFDAALAEARRLLGLDGLTPARPAVRALNPDERRLAADRPPHW